MLDGSPRPSQAKEGFLTPNDRLAIMLTELDEASKAIRKLLQQKIETTKNPDLLKIIQVNLSELMIHYQSLSFNDLNPQQHEIFEDLNYLDTQNLASLLFEVNKAMGVIESKLRTPREDIGRIQSYYRTQFIQVLEGFEKNPSLEKLLELHRLTLGYTFNTPPGAAKPSSAYITTHQLSLDFNKQVKDNVTAVLKHGNNYLCKETLPRMKAFLRIYRDYLPQQYNPSN